MAKLLVFIQATVQTPKLVLDLLSELWKKTKKMRKYSMSEASICHLGIGVTLFLLNEYLNMTATRHKT